MVVHSLLDDNSLWDAVVVDSAECLTDEVAGSNCVEVPKSVGDFSLWLDKLDLSERAVEGYAIVTHFQASVTINFGQTSVGLVTFAKRHAVEVVLSCKVAHWAQWAGLFVFGVGVGVRVGVQGYLELNSSRVVCACIRWNNTNASNSIAEVQRKLELSCRSKDDVVNAVLFVTSSKSCTSCGRQLDFLTSQVAVAGLSDNTVGGTYVSSGDRELFHAYRSCRSGETEVGADVSSVGATVRVASSVLDANASFVLHIEDGQGCVQLVLTTASHADDSNVAKGSTVRSNSHCLIQANWCGGADSSSRHVDEDFSSKVAGRRRQTEEVAIFFVDVVKGTFRLGSSFEDGLSCSVDVSIEVNLLSSAQTVVEAEEHRIATRGHDRLSRAATSVKNGCGVGALVSKSNWGAAKSVSLSCCNLNGVDVYLDSVNSCARSDSSRSSCGRQLGHINQVAC